MTSLFNRWIPSFTLATWSAVLIGTYATGRVTAFLHPSFRLGVLISGIVLAGLALMIASRPTPPECCADATCTHPLSRSQGGRWLTFAILVLPVAVAAWLSPENFSKQLMENRGISTDATGLGNRRAPAPAPTGAAPSASSADSATTPAKSTSPEPSATAAPNTPADPSVQPAAPAALPTTQSAPNPQNLPEYLQRTPEGHIVAEILDLLYSVQDSQLRKDFEGKTIQLIAQAMPDKKSAAGSHRFKAVRMFMTCCAADARPVATLVQAENAADLPEMSWVKIIGKATFPIENGKRTAVVEATSVLPTKPPEESMLFQ
ncbi:MAG: TIGR03943 family protein [Verrucomicrobiota bacterium]